jgi:metallo-beta-lactamase family protein
MKRVAAFATTRFVTVSSPQQSADLVASRQPSIVIASSGMATGGRVLRHLAATISNPKNTVMFVGYQRPARAAACWMDGAREIQALGRIIRSPPRRAHRLDVGARRLQREHAVARVSPRSAMTYLVHGDPVAFAALRRASRGEAVAGRTSRAHLERVEELPAIRLD